MSTKFYNFWVLHRNRFPTKQCIGLYCPQHLLRVPTLPCRNNIVRFLCCLKVKFAHELCWQTINSANHTKLYWSVYRRCLICSPSPIITHLMLNFWHRIMRKKWRFNECLEEFKYWYRRENKFTSVIIITCRPILTSRDLQTSRFGLVSAGEANVSVSGFNVSCPSLA